MNKHKDPAIYALTYEGRVFYVGRTAVNALNRLWQHRYRAESGHPAPVYRWMREVGISNVTFEILERITKASEARKLEAFWIAKLIEEGQPLTNATGRDGIPDSISEDTKRQIGVSKRGKSTWIKGKTGEDAGWTEDRRQAQSDRRRGVFKHGSKRQALELNCPCNPCEIWRVGNPGVGKGRGFKVQRQRDIHGTVASYKHGKCRCNDCRTAYREYQRRFQ